MSIDLVGVSTDLKLSVLTCLGGVSTDLEVYLFIWRCVYGFGGVFRDVEVCPLI